MTQWTCPKCTFLNADSMMQECEMCQAPRVFVCAKCRCEIGVGIRVMVGGETYHKECFCCAACHKPFTTTSFLVKDGEHYHAQCFKTLFAPVCEVCGEYIPADAQNRIQFSVVPFWNMRYCPKHTDRDRCCSCHRLEPTDPAKQFHLLSDGRKTCHDCCVNVILDTDEVQEIIEEVWDFMKSSGISLPKIPVYLVDYPTLNENIHQASHMPPSGSNAPRHFNSFVTRGLCLSQVTELRHFVSNSRTHTQQVVRVDKNRSINAILILHGLPHDLTAQVLAHEATHAYIKLQDGFPDRIQPKVEEGVCQLMSFLWLRYKHALCEQQHADAQTPFAKRLREYYMHQLETDPSPVYGDGFRDALNAYNRLHSLDALFRHIRQCGTLP